MPVEIGTKDKPVTTWISIAWWAPKEVPDWWFEAVNNMKKGDLVTVIGLRPKVETWKDKNTGEPRAKLTMTADRVVNGKRKDAAAAPVARHTTMTEEQFNAKQQGGAEDVPF